jgi:hypothetical protein
MLPIRGIKRAKITEFTGYVRGGFIRSSEGMDAARLKIEETILERNFPRRFAFLDREIPERFRLEIGLKTSSGNTYRLEIPLSVDYPNQVPPVYLTYPVPLRDFNGHSLALLSPSHPMHLLKPRSDQAIQVCHYKAENWHPNVTLYKVVLKCYIWLEAFQQHLQTGKPLINYLGV